jgi:hypothetical protein
VDKWNAGGKRPPLYAGLNGAVCSLHSDVSNLGLLG